MAALYASREGKRERLAWASAVIIAPIGNNSMFAGSIAKLLG